MICCIFLSPIARGGLPRIPGRSTIVTNRRGHDMDGRRSLLTMTVAAMHFCVACSSPQPTHLSGDSETTIVKPSAARSGGDLNSQQFATSGAPSSHRYVFLVEPAAGANPETWRLVPACAPDASIPAAAREAVELARAYLARRNLLAPEHRFCAAAVGGNRWQVTNLPAGRYINSAIAVAVVNGRAEGHVYTTPADYRDELDVDSLLEWRSRGRGPRGSAPGPAPPNFNPPADAPTMPPFPLPE
ncbi:hypothetical protein RAS2_01190 [Phycisphaerae bacterium RAS2]|nr:hypothetical protein RAS2_01190 [Phycisphaerae bacterium RAS2]